MYRPVEGVDLARVWDGVYIGKHRYGVFSFKVEVTVSQHRIADIRIIKNSGQKKYAKMAEAVIDRVLRAQSVEVDAVSGATMSSKGLLNAVRDALNKGITQ